MKLSFRRLLGATLVFPAAFLSAAVIGTNPLAQPLTSARIDQLDASQRATWSEYLARSHRLGAEARAAFEAELKSAGRDAPLIPEKGGSILLQRPPEFWSGAEAARSATLLVSFQTPAGGWSKNTNFTREVRQGGERYGFESGYDGTIDNGGTVAPLRFLARAIAGARADTAVVAVWKTSFLRGIEYLLVAQYPSGGWPQVFPLVGAYHDAITFNDDAIVGVLTLLRDVAEGGPDFNFTSAAIRARAAAAVQRGLDCIIATQIVTNGRRTVWCQQHDMITLAPCAARNYEMPAQAAGESAALARYLMTLPNPSPAVITAVHAAAAWFEKTRLRDVAYKLASDGSGRTLIATPGAGPLWPRFSEIGTDRPIFGDRDLTIHDDVNGISRERRNGYGWYGDGPKRTLDHYEKWARQYPQK